VVDNLLGAHKEGREGVRRELIEERGCQLLLCTCPAVLLAGLQPHRGGSLLKESKGALRKAGARTREALIEALGAAISALTARDARSFFEHGGYHLPIQLL
jgi:hypothetical protein